MNKNYKENKINIQNHIKNLCPEYRKSGSGICFNVSCDYFHPLKMCSLNKKCKRKVCCFRHDQNYYLNQFKCFCYKYLNIQIFQNLVLKYYFQCYDYLNNK